MTTDLIKKDSYTLLDTAQLIASVNIVTIKCPCKTIIMGQMGQPLVCTSYKRVWFVSATAKITVNEVAASLGDSDKESKLITQ